MTQQLLKQRTTTHYRGIKKYDNAYSGLIFCGDCGSPMFSMSRGDMAAAYMCGTYHKRGLKGCTSHHVRVDMLDAILKQYVIKIRDNSQGMLKELESSIKNESTEIKENKTTLSILERHLREAKDELKAIKKRKILEIAKLEARADHDPAAHDQIDIIEETYSELEAETTLRISGLQTQVNLTIGKRNDIIRINRLARTVIDVFNDIIDKPKLDRTDLQLIIDRIIIYEGHIDVKLKADVDAILHSENRETRELPSNFNKDSKVILNTNGRISSMYTTNTCHSPTKKVRLKTRNQPERLFTVNVISSGDPLEIFTDREGEIILKKYSPIGELSAFAKQYADALAQSCGHIVSITDRDHHIAVSGAARKELLGQPVGPALENLINQRDTRCAADKDKDFIPISSQETSHFTAQVICPIITEGDAVGAVIITSRNENVKMGEVEQKLASAAAGFLGRQLEQ